MTAFRADGISEFRLRGFEADAARGVALLRYSLDDTYHFEERIEFGRGITGPQGHVTGFARAVRLLHFAGGVSYYKTAAPPVIVVEDELSEAEVELCRAIYELGMRDFAYRNGLPIPRDIEIVAEPDGAKAPPGAIPPASAVSPPDPGIAVPIGGGKDSIVVLEALRAFDPVVVSVNPTPAAKRVAATAGRELMEIARGLDPLLFELNAKGAMNGHVPVTAIVSLITIAGGYLFGYDTTAIALEGSADAPSRVVVNEIAAAGSGAVLHHEEVNHQWSKSAQFERQLQDVVRGSVNDSIRFVSPLRPFSEIEITAAFATLSPYLRIFRSCNQTARLQNAADSWCCDCPKCRFVFLALASALDRRSVVEIFGSDLLDDPSQTRGFCDMLDPDRKPFECVGTVEEVEDAFRGLLNAHEWQGSAVLESVRQMMSELPRAKGQSASPSEVFETVRNVVAGAGRK